jgi:DNA-binding transcriptional ArsR family regulator
MNTCSYIYMFERLEMETTVQESLDTQTASRVAELFQALSDPSRVRILAALMHGEVNVGGLAITIGISESAVSHHLRNLRLMRLVRTRKVGRHVFYSLDDDHITELIQSGMDHVIHG